MPKDDKAVAQTTPPKELPMPKYGYQKSECGSVSSRYKDEESRKAEPVHHLNNVHFG